jgi:hypothetical protein
MRPAESTLAADTRWEAAVMAEEAAAAGCADRAPLIQRPELERQVALEQIG